VQKSVPVKLARRLPYITIGCCFDSHPRINSSLQKPGFRYGLLKSAVDRINKDRINKEIAATARRFHFAKRSF
jgi:hypothetical protein